VGLFIGLLTHCHEVLTKDSAKKLKGQTEGGPTMPYFSKYTTKPKFRTLPKE
jgi:hypothetical protein